MRVTIAICTFNRAKSLDRTLETLTHLRIPPGVEWEVLVVNNNSTDETEAVVARHAHHLPVRHLFEPQPGKSRAANLAVHEAAGQLVLWTDDDVLVDKDWIVEYVAASKEWPEAAFFGGTVEAWFEGKAPAWVEANVQLFSEPFALANHGAGIFPLGEQAVVGANMAMKADVLRRFPFDLSLGPTGTKALRGEETELMGRLRAAGLRGVWVGSATVKHVINPERLNVAYLWHWYSGLGSYVANRAPIAMDVPLVCGVPRWALKKYLGLLVKYWLLTPFKRASWVRALREAALMKGYILEARHMTHKNR